MKSLWMSLWEKTCQSSITFVILLFKYLVRLFYYQRLVYYKYLISSDKFMCSEIIHFGENEQVSKKDFLLSSRLIPCCKWSVYFNSHCGLCEHSLPFASLYVMAWAFFLYSIKEISGNQQNARLPWDIRQIES